MRIFNSPSTLVLVAFALILLTPLAGAQSVSVSNLSETGTTRMLAIGNLNWIATSFTTAGGSNARYTLNNVVIKLSGSAPTVFTVELFSEANGQPNTQIGSGLTAPASFAVGNNVFTASGITLHGDTTYFVVVGAAETSFYDVFPVLSNGQSGTTGWSIGDGLCRQANVKVPPWTCSTSFGTDASLQFAVNATTVSSVEPDNDGGAGGASGTGTTRDTGERAPVICEQQLAGDGTVYGTWNRECPSLARSNTYAHYYAFTLESQSNVTISLESAIDTYVYLRRGDRFGPKIAADDDGGNGYNSLLRTTLAAGTYAIEATTFRDETTGIYALRVAGLGRRAPTDQPFACGERLAGDGAVLGIWTADCASVARDGNYARYYVFALDERSRTTISLESSVDAFLYLRKGRTKQSPVIASDDDSGGGYNARVSQTLEAGTYVIEATTFYGRMTGNFTLRLADTGDAADPEGGAVGSTGGGSSTDDGGPLNAPIAFATPEDWGITLFWHTVTGATGYEYQYVYADDGWDSDWVQHRSVGADILSVALRDEISAYPYNFRVRSVKDADGERMVSDWSATVTAESN